MLSRNIAYERKEQLRNELKVELPVPIDTKRYLIGKVAFIDLAYYVPFLLFSILATIFLYLGGMLGKVTLTIAFAPTIAIVVFQSIKHPVRKEITLLQYSVLWKYKYKKRVKEFFYKKGELQMSEKNDARRKIGIKTTYADCYETNDNHFVRVFEVSSVNLSLANRPEKRSALDAFKVFMNTTNFLKDIQFSQIAQPINLSRHIQVTESKTKNEQNTTKRLLNRSYSKFVENIQKSTDLVTRKRYVILRVKIGNDRDRALDDIDQKSKLLISKLESMVLDYTTLRINQLNNEQLSKLIYTCIDYDNAVAIGSYIGDRASNRSNVTVGEESAQQLIDTLQRQLKENIS
ncbi:hypothetical protein [Bacillus sp. 1P06AnD]|uniref:hypothetical protein n=1 Tax=Bacillus sp. 1P06AnD TaxID=3132208 RepID=UPI0039A1E8F8